MIMRRSDNKASLSPFSSESGHSAERKIQDEAAFHHTISVERKRTERSKNPFLLMLLETGNGNGSAKNGQALQNLLSALAATTRDTDVIGWYKSQSTIGVVFTELTFADKGSVLSTMLTRMSSTLRDSMTFEQLGRISISFHLFPDDWDHDTPGRPSNPTLYPDHASESKSFSMLPLIKRVMDIVGSIIALIILAPAFAIIAAIVKLSSKGPVFFRQPRVGYHGKTFTFLKFRSMYVNNDSSAHKEFVTQLIAGKTPGNGHNGNGAGVYKMAHDPRITPIGGFLRRTSLDELPQFVNVLTGDMSLVGPRPAIPYEVASYQTWHRRRVLDVKPGITGLWQVHGRSRVKFDDMVRLDIRYAKAWSPWLDVKILAKTPRAVVSGNGAV
jgi:lipopolysaccharide/colanic/teichoic acid biosynthesis glycosyltransferase